jgi:hypothetical protein
MGLYGKYRPCVPLLLNGEGKVYQGMVVEWMFQADGINGVQASIYAGHKSGDSEVG